MRRAGRGGLAALAFALAAACAPDARAGDADNPELPPPEPLASPAPRAHRDSSEIVLLYFASIGWAGSASVFVDGVAQASNPYASATAWAYLLAPATGALGVIVPPLVDRAYDRRPGVAQTITTSMLVGLGEGIALNEYFSNRAIDSFHSYTKDAAWVFGGTSAGLATGLVLAAVVHTTPGRAAWVATTGIFGGLFAASLAGVASRPQGYPNPEFDRDGIRNVGITAAIAGAAGVAGGVATASWISPSTLRVHLIDLAWIGGMTIPGLACINHCSPEATFALMGTGGAVGFGSALALTALMPRGSRDDRGVAMLPFASPLPGGGLEVGFGGAL